MKISCPFLACFSQKDPQTGTFRDKKREDPDQNLEAFRVFSFNELKFATQNFHYSNKVGQGGFGSVYKGRLRDGKFVAVKVLSIELESMRGEREFVAELASLSNARHENLVILHGCCVEGAKRYLIYEFMENNSVAHTLSGNFWFNFIKGRSPIKKYCITCRIWYWSFGCLCFVFLFVLKFLSKGGEQNRVKFSWETRRDVSIGVARALAYLHEEVQPHIVHRDIKSSNILLDQNWTPKVSDFGLAKLLGDENSYISTRVAGTLGYLAPEYAVTGRLTRKSDVYSFGVLLLEIVSGQQVLSFDDAHNERFLVEKAWASHETKNLIQLVDPILIGMDFPEEEAVRYLKVGLLCVQETSSLRPGMSKVVEMLTRKVGIEDDKISKPGRVADIMNIKMNQRSLPQDESGLSGSVGSSMWSMSGLAR